VIDATHCEAPRALFLDADDCLIASPAIKPVVVDGKAIGLRNDRIGSNSILGLCGVHSGDVWTRVNGETVAEPEDALQLYPKLRKAEKLTIDLLRDGESHTIEIAFR
jgi:type II secretory pathway component PulC